MASTTVLLQAALVGAASAAAAIYLWRGTPDGGRRHTDYAHLFRGDPVRDRLASTTATFVRSATESINVSMDASAPAAKRQKALNEVIEQYITPVAVVGAVSTRFFDWYSGADSKAVLFMGRWYPGRALVEREAYNDLRAKWIRSLKANGVFDCVDQRNRSKESALELQSDGKLGSWSRSYELQNDCMKDFDPNHLSAWAKTAAAADAASE